MWYRIPLPELARSQHFTQRMTDRAVHVDEIAALLEDAYVTHCGAGTVRLTHPDTDLAVVLALADHGRPATLITVYRLTTRYQPFRHRPRPRRTNRR